MCDRYAIEHRADEIAPFLRCDAGELAEAPTDVAPLRFGAVVRLTEPKTRHASPMRWGLVPPWAPELGYGATLTVAGAERLFTRRSTRQAARHRRCLIPASVYTERKAENGTLQPIRVARKDTAPFAFAGVWENWRAPSGETVETFAIISAGVSNAHPQGIPVIIDPRDFALWLDPDLRQIDGQRRLLRPFNEREMRIERLDPAGAMAAAQCMRADFGRSRQSGRAATGPSGQLRREVCTETVRLLALSQDVSRSVTRMRALLDGRG